jgi:hypothetical protein
MCRCFLQEESIADMRGDIEAFLQDNPEILAKAKMTVVDVLQVLSLVGNRRCTKKQLHHSQLISSFIHLPYSQSNITIVQT